MRAFAFSIIFSLLIPYFAKRSMYGPVSPNLSSKPIVATFALRPLVKATSPRAEAYPPARRGSSTVRSLPVLSAEAKRVSASRGLTKGTENTSASIPSWLRASAAYMA